MVHLEILDTAGQDDFSPLRDSWIRESEGFILIYGVTDRESLEYLTGILAQIERTKSEIPGWHRRNILVCGNKIDLVDRRSVGQAEAEAWGREHGVQMCEFSSKTRQNLMETYTKIIGQIVESKDGPAGKSKKSQRTERACNIL